MKFTANLSNAARVLYLVVGAALVVAPFAFGHEGWVRWVVPILGVGSIAEGAVGCCALRAVLGSSTHE